MGQVAPFSTFHTFLLEKGRKRRICGDPTGKSTSLSLPTNVEMWDLLEEEGRGGREKPSSFALHPCTQSSFDCLVSPRGEKKKGETQERPFQKSLARGRRFFFVEQASTGGTRRLRGGERLARKGEKF